MAAERKYARLEEFERAVYCRTTEDRAAQNKKAFDIMCGSLQALREGSGFGPNQLMSPALVTRMAAAIVALIGDPSFDVTEDQFIQLCCDRNVLDTVFQASTFGTSDFVFSLIDEKTPCPNKFLAMSSINSPLNLDWETVFKGNPDKTIGLWLSLVGYGQVFTEASDTRREKLIALAPLFENVALPASLLNTLTSAYMHCSYAHGRDKHVIKGVLHKILRNTVHVDECQAGKRPRKDRPTILVCHEWWHRRHAMYRSYARSIDQLRERFNVVGMAHEGVADVESRQHFNSWIEIGGTAVILSEVAKKIREIDPDIIYYPSVGMSVWTIAMASFRLAPIQVMSYGHPATTHSRVIDYGIIEADTFVQDRFSEKILTLPPNTVRPTEFQPIATRHVPRNTDVLRIGVCAMQVKVSWPFVRAMQEVARQATKKVEFYFFSAVYGVGLYSFANEIGRLLPNVTVQEAQPYEEYMESVAKCDLVLFSYPFGGTNSMIDAMVLGVPVVTFLGTEPHSMSDTALVRRAGLPESLVAKTESEYVQAVLKMQNDHYRGLVAELMRGVPVEERFFRPDDNKEFLKTFERIYDDNTTKETMHVPV